MELLHPACFASIVASSKPMLENISNKFIKKYLGESVSKQFIEACDKLDSDSANEILDKLVFELSDTSSNIVSICLSVLAHKFSDLIPALDDGMTKALSERDKVEIIAKYAPQMLSIIDESLNSQKK